MTLDPTAALRLYDEAWTIPDYESRLATLRTIWADDGLYLDPDVPEGARGPEALAAVIDAQLELYPGMSIVSSAPDVLGDRAWFRWSATLGTGESFTGVDFVEFAPDGRIARLTGFYEP
jgi:SnoaL-like domain